MARSIVIACIGILGLISCSSTSDKKIAVSPQALILPDGLVLNAKMQVTLPDDQSYYKISFDDLPLPPAVGLSSTSQSLAASDKANSVVGITINTDQQPCLKLIGSYSSINKRVIRALKNWDIAKQPVNDYKLSYELEGGNRIVVYPSLYASYLTIKDIHDQYLQSEKARALLVELSEKFIAHPS